MKVKKAVSGGGPLATAMNHTKNKIAGRIFRPLPVSRHSKLKKNGVLLSAF